MKWLATYIGDAPRFLCSSKGLEWAPGEAKEVDEETALLLGAFPDLVQLEQVEGAHHGKKHEEPPAEEPVPDDTVPAGNEG
jgi:hypothetical protein